MGATAWQVMDTVRCSLLLVLEQRGVIPTFGLHLQCQPYTNILHSFFLRRTNGLFLWHTHTM